MYKFPSQPLQSDDFQDLAKCKSGRISNTIHCSDATDMLTNETMSKETNVFPSCVASKMHNSQMENGQKTGVKDVHTHSQTCLSVHLHTRTRTHTHAHTHTHTHTNMHRIGLHTIFCQGCYTEMYMLSATLKCVCMLVGGGGGGGQVGK